MGNTHRFMSVGFGDGNADREYGIWDLRQVGKPLQKKTLDACLSIMYLHFDYDINVAFVSNKGSSFMSLFYLDESHTSGKPTMIELSKYKRPDNATILQTFFMQKRYVDCNNHEL